MGIEYKIKRFDNVKNSLVGKILAYGLAGSLAFGGVYNCNAIDKALDKRIIKKAIKEDMDATSFMLTPDIAYKGNVECMIKLDDYDIKSIEVNGKLATAVVETTFKIVCGDCSVSTRDAIIRYKLESRHTLAEGYVWVPISAEGDGPFEEKASIIKTIGCYFERIF